MVIRPMLAAYALGETGRSAVISGAKGGPTAFFASLKDEVVLGEKKTPGPGTYSASPLFKMMGAVELMSEEHDLLDGGTVFGDAAILL